MKICGTVPVEVPECEDGGCSGDCTLWIADNCPHEVHIECIGNKYIPGPTCPAFDTVPSPWADIPGYEDRPWNDEVEDALIEAQLERANKRPLDFPWVGVKKSYPCTKEQAEYAEAVFQAIADAKKEELFGKEER